MNSEKLNTEAILEVACEIRNPRIRATYLSQVCFDSELRSRLEQRLKTHRRWQFGLRSLFVIMIIASVLMAGLAYSFQAALRAQRMAEMERLRAMEAARQAADAFQQLSQQLGKPTQTAERQSDNAPSEGSVP